MCHPSVLHWVGSLPADLFTGRTVVEVGSYDVNGSVRPGIMAHNPTSYLGVDISEGPGVDLVANVGDLPAKFPVGFGAVISTEMLEHVEDWRAACEALIRLVTRGGSLVVSTRAPGFPYHPYPGDYWRYPPPLMRQILESAGLAVSVCIDDWEQAGVFVVAHKPKEWTVPEVWFSGIEVPGV